jgi:hypothetical protein
MRHAHIALSGECEALRNWLGGHYKSRSVILDVRARRRDGHVWLCGRDSPFGTLQVSMRRRGDQQLVLNALVDLKRRVVSSAFPNSGPWIVARALGAVGKEVVGHVLDHRVENRSVAAHAYQRVRLSLHEPCVYR